MLGGPCPLELQPLKELLETQEKMRGPSINQTHLCFEDNCGLGEQDSSLRAPGNPSEGRSEQDQAAVLATISLLCIPT